MKNNEEERKKRIDKIMQIRYVKLHLELQFMNHCQVPKYKTSAIRGGMGEMLLQMNCIRDRNCSSCGFEKECIVQRMLYSQMEIQPEFMHQGDSVGYVIECENMREIFEAGEILECNLILFGKNIVYLSQYLQAFSILGMNGLGKEKARFEICGVLNTKREVLALGNEMNLFKYQVQTIKDYIDYRKKKYSFDTMRIIMHTPFTLKYKGCFLQQMNMEAFLRAIIRRLYILDCFEGIEEKQIFLDEGILPVIEEENTYKQSIRRYSTRHDEKVILKGIQGYFDISRIDRTVYDLLLAGELIHIGKNTSFGFGRYSVII